MMSDVNERKSRIEEYIKSLTPEERERHKELIEECRKREQEIRESYDSARKSIQEVSENYKKMGENLKKMCEFYGELEKLVHAADKLNKATNSLEGVYAAYFLLNRKDGKKYS